MPYVDVGGGNKLFYREKNSRGEIPLLFCHGSGGNSGHWTYQAALPKEFRLIFLDLPGHGESTGPPLNTVEGYREVIKSMVEELQPGKFFLVGHSLGGAITLDYARCYPDDLRGMILVSTGARLKVLPSILETFRNKEFVPEMPYYIYGKNADPKLIQESQREMSETPPEVFYADFSACDEFDIMGELSGINVPALVIVGDEDRLTPEKYSHYLAENLPRAELFVIEGAGHMVMLENSNLVNQSISDFIQSP